MRSLGECYSIRDSDATGLMALAESRKFDLVLIGPEVPLTLGLADEMRNRRIPVFGPSASAARVEGSKIFAKRLMQKYGIPTAHYFEFDSPEDACRFLTSPDFEYPLVVKADGLAAGKGVVIAGNQHEATSAVTSMMVQEKFGKSGKRIIVEECLQGTEISFFALAYGTGAVGIGSAQDYKRLLDGDRGPNTGGMGSITPSPLMTGALAVHIMETIIQPTLDGLRSEESEFCGLLYAGLMMTRDGPKVIEYNCRFGDPETQPLVLNMGDGFGEALLTAARGEKPSLPVQSDTKAVCVVLASGGYPEHPNTGKRVNGLESPLPKDAIIFHAGTACREGEIVTSGGRVLSVCATGLTYDAARRIVYDAIEKISFDGMQFRRDIAVMKPSEP